MTEYTTSSQAVREYLTSRERTAYWVQSHSPNENEFYSPSAAPSVLDGLVPSSPPSEAESSSSVPPKMVLRYGDGRPDIPIPYADPVQSGSRRQYGDPPSRSQTFPRNTDYRPRSGSHGSSPLSRTQSRRPDHRERSPPRAPEEIRILPSRGNDIPRSLHHPRSKSLPRNADLRAQGDAQVPFIPPPPHPIYPPSTSFAHPPQAPGPGQQVTFSQPQPHPWHSYAGRPVHGPHQPPKHMPPSIVYAPAHHSRTHYSPPAIYNHPPQMGPNGMIYSHSAPVTQMQYPRTAGSVSYQPGIAPLSQPLASVHEERRSGRDKSSSSKHDRARSLSLARSAARVSPSSSSSSSLNSRNSGSTYYVLPAAGQKVHIISPSPHSSFVTATSTTKSPTSPHSGQFKKSPFLQRLFSFAGKFSSAGSSKASYTGGRRLHRRHSTGGSGRTRVIDQGR